MSHLSFFILLFVSLNCFSQKKWDGEAGNNQWSNAINWTGNAVPSSTDNVVLDNSLVTNNYSISLPSTAVTVKTITITPSASRTIELTLPATNTALPGLTMNGPGYSLVINSGGTFRNSSGSASGSAVRVIDSIRINNGGRYVHNSASGHTTNVQTLATIAGTESGIFELDVPSASSTISLSGRTFGKLVLRSSAAGGTCNYTAAGTSKVNIRNTLDLGAGVNFNLNCSDTIFVGTDFLQDAGTLNLGNSTRSVVLSIKQNATQNSGGIITETGTGTQTILINGSGFQLVAFRGTISNQVSLVKDGAGVLWSKAAMSLPYKLQLKNGRILTSQGLITLQAACIIQADSLAANSFIEGPLKKDGLNNQSFLFPVGKSGTMRWVQLKNATGNFTVEYFRSNPEALSNVNGSGIHHISSIEYWDVTTTSSATAEAKLSFLYPGSGEITNLASLRVARLINGIWQDAGNTAVSGTPGSDGWVSSIAAGGFSANSKSFALASATGLENPLPLSSILLRTSLYGGKVTFLWSSDNDIKFQKFQLQRSYDGVNYQTIFETISETRFTFSPESKNSYYRVKAACENGSTSYLSNIVYIPFKPGAQSTYIVVDVSGRIIKSFKENSLYIKKTIKSYMNELRPGIYFIREISGRNTFKYVKPII
jgi:hypothetical protein